jgi:hypothetical protein
MPRKAMGTKGRGKRVALNMKTTEKTREMLTRAAAASGRSLIQEVEQRVERSLVSEVELYGQWAPLYRLIQQYLRSLAILRTKNGKAELDALHVAFDAVIDAANSGPLSDERLKRLQLEIIPELGRRGGNNAAGIVTDALNVLSFAGLADLDHNKLSAWIRETANAR